MDVINFNKVFMFMNTELKAYNFWNGLSTNERFEFLAENCFWDGFSNYLYEYLPEDLKKIIRLKTA